MLNTDAPEFVPNQTAKAGGGSSHQDLQNSIDDELDTTVKVDEIFAKMPDHIKQQPDSRAFIREIVLHSDKKSRYRMLTALRNSTGDGKGMEQIAPGASFVGFMKMFRQSVQRHGRWALKWCLTRTSRENLEYYRRQGYIYL